MNICEILWSYEQFSKDVSVTLSTAIHFLLCHKTHNTLYTLCFYTFGESVLIFVKQTL